MPRKRSRSTSKPTAVLTVDPRFKGKLTVDPRFKGGTLTVDQRFVAKRGDKLTVDRDRL